MRPLCLLGSTSSHTNHDYHIGNKSNCDDACAVGRLISQLVSRHYKWYRTLPCRTVKTEDKKKGNERTKGGRALIRVTIGLETAFTKQGQCHFHFHFQVTWCSEVEKLVDCFS